MTANIPGLPIADTDTAGTDNVNLFGAWIPYQAGDYFEFDIFSTNAQTLTDNVWTWFCIEMR